MGYYSVLRSWRSPKRNVQEQTRTICYDASSIDVVCMLSDCRIDIVVCTDGVSNTGRVYELLLVHRKTYLSVRVAHY